MPTHDSPGHDPHDPHNPGIDSPGYEVTDVNVNGIVVFLASLGAFVGVFFIFCFGMGKVINTAILKSDGPPNKWNMIGAQPTGKRQDLTSNAVMEQNQLNQMVQRFPTPRLQIDDGDQDIAEMHAREDLGGSLEWQGPHSRRPRDANHRGARTTRRSRGANQ
jgi:hypothetical protein